MNFYNEDEKQIIKSLNTTRNGLTTEEALERLNNNGKNVLKNVKVESAFAKFFNEFKDLMIILLLISSAISFAISVVKNEPFADSIIILLIVVINAILGFIQELKADKAIEALKKMQVTEVKVKRDNKLTLINSEDLVVGDLIVLEAGDIIPADARIIEYSALKVNEASLTGESLPIEKNNKALKGNIELSRRTNMLYSGTSVVYGKAQAIVTSIGMDTELGLIAEGLTETEKEATQLQKRIDNISKVLTVIILIVIFVMFVVGLYKDINLLELIMLSISLAVAAIPEGLPAVITIVLSLGMSTMAKKNAIVRKMSSVESLGCTEIICSDKTGTITQNKMQVVKTFSLDNELLLTDLMLLNNDVEENDGKLIGEPTEVALYEYALERVNIRETQNKHFRIAELPFDSERKMMSTLNHFDGYRLITKGSFDSLIKRCTKILVNGKVKKITKKDIETLYEIEDTEAKNSYRILAFAYKDLDKKMKLSFKEENDLIFVGMAFMIDPPREDVKDAINLCKSANIRTIMITGDSLSTATSIAKDVGILKSKNEAILGSELENMSDEELSEAVLKYNVFARVSPTNKLQIVKKLKEHNKVVAMTGDGVNDAPAIKNANIGIGMGITGTDVSKSVSDIVLADDSFSTIVLAVREGRRIYDNIRNVLTYLLTGNIAEIIVIFTGLLFGKEIFIPIQLLYINLITDSIPAIALAFEKEADGIMNRSIRKKDSSFFTNFLVGKMSTSVILKTIVLLTIYFVSLNYFGEEVAQSMTFLTLVLTEMIFSLTCKNLKKNLLNKELFSNSKLNLSLLILSAIQLLVFATPIRTMFGLVALSINEYIVCLVIVLVMFIVDELTKPIINKIFKDE